METETNLPEDASATAVDLHEATVNTCVENEEKSEQHYHVQKQETADSKHLNLGLNTAKINPSNDTGELEKALASHTPEKLEIMDGGKIKHAEARKMEAETEIQIPKIAIESVPKDEALSILPKLVVVDQSEMAEKSFEKESREEEESTATDNGHSCRPGKELEQMFKALEEIDLPQIVGKDAAENEHTHQSETPGNKNVFTKHSEAMLTMESSTKSSHDVEELAKISESHSVDNSETKCDGILMPGKEIGIKEATEVKFQKSQTASVPAEKALSTLHPTVSVGVQTVEESIQVEMHNEVEQAVTTTKEEQRSDNDFEEKKNVLEACDLHEATRDACVENDKKDEIKTEEQTLETIVVKPLDLEGETTEVNMSNDSEGHEKVPVSPPNEELEIKEGRTWIQEEAKDIKDAIEDDALSTLPPSANVQGEATEEIFRKQNLKEEESAATDKCNSSQPEYELEQTANVFEACDLHEATRSTCLENEKKDEIITEEQTLETIVVKPLDLEGETIEVNMSNDSEGHDKVPESPPNEELEIKEGRTWIQEEAKDIKDAIEDDALSTLPPSANVQGEATEEIFRKQNLKEEESAATDKCNSSQPEYELEQTANVFEAFDLHEATRSTCLENEKKDEIITEEQKLETIVVKPLDLEGETIEVNMSNDSEGHDKVPESPPNEELEIKEGRIWIQEEEKDIVEAIEDEALSTLPTSANVQGEATEEIFQKQNLKEEESAATDKCNSSQPEYELEQTANVFEACDLHEAATDTCVENEKKDGIKTELQNLESIVVKHLDLEGEAIEVNTSNETEGHEKVPVSPTEEELDIEEGRTWIQEEAKDIEEVIEDEASFTLPTSAIAKGDAIDKIFQKQNINEEESAAMDKGNSNQPEYELEQTTNVFEVNDQSETMAYVGVYNEQNSVHKSDTSTTEIVITEDVNAGGMATIESSKKSTYVVDEQEMIPESHSVNNSEIEDGSKITTDEATEIHQATNMEIKKSIIESAPEDVALSILHTSASVEVDRDEESIQEEMQMKEEILEDDAQSKLHMLEIEKDETVKEISNQQTLQEEESAAIDNDKSCSPEKELEKMDNVIEAVDQPKTIAKVSAENGEQEGHQSVASSMEIASMNMKLINEEGEVTSVSSSKSNYNTNNLEKIPQSPSVVDSYKKDDSKIRPEEQTDIKESTDVELENAETESVPEDKSLTSLQNTASVTAETVEESIQEELYVEKKIPKEFCVHDITCYTSAKNEQETEPRFEVQNLETIITKNPNLDGDTTEINLTNDTEEHEKFLVSHTREKLRIEDDGKFTPEEAKAMEQTPDMQILKTEIQSVPEDEAHSEFPKLVIVKGETEESLPQQMIEEEEESAVAHNNKSTSPENELYKMANMVEAIDQPETVAKTSEENENAVHLSKASNMESVITKEINAEGKKTPESNRKSSHDVDEKDQGVLDEKSQPTLPNTAFYGVEAVETCIQQELHKAEFEVRDIKGEQIQERDFEDENKVPEVFGLYKVTHQTNAENEQKAEPQCKAQNQDAPFTEHQNLEGQTADIINPSSDADEHEIVSQTAEKLETAEDGTFKQEEANEKEGATELQLLEPAIESVPEDKALETLPSTTFVNDKADEGSIEEEIQEELAVINTTERQIPEIDLEAFGLHKVARQTSEENELKAEPQSEAKNQKTTSIQHLNLEGKTTSIINPINDTDLQEKVPVSHSGEKLALEDDGELKQEEEKEKEEATEMQILKTASESVPEDKALQILPSTTPVGDEEAETTIQEEIQEESELALELTHQTSEKNELKAESKAQNQETTVIKHPSLEGKTTNITNPINETEEKEKILASHSNDKSVLEDDGKFKQEEAKDMEEATQMQILQTASEGVPEDKANTELAGVGVAEESIQEENHPEAELAVTNTEGQKPEIDFMEEKKVPEAFSLDEVAQQINAENELKLEPQSQAHNEMTTFIKHPHMEGLGKTTDIINPTNDDEEQENVLESHTGGKLEIEDDGKSIQEEEKVMDEENGMQLPITPSESVPEDKARETLPSTASLGFEAVATSIQEVPAEAELAMTNTKQGHIPETDFEKKKLPEAFVLHEVTLQDNVENELNAEYHSEERNQVITSIRHPNLEGQTTEINPTNDTGEQEHVSASQRREKLDFEDDGKFIQEEAKEMEEATEMQSPKTATQSVPEENSQSSLPNTPYVDVEVDKTSTQQETHMEVELSVDNSKEGHIPENDFNEENKNPEYSLKHVFGLHEGTHQTSENELKAEHQSEEQNQETTFIKHPNLEGYTLDIIKPTNDIEEQEKFLVSHTGEKLEYVKDGKSLQGGAEVIEEATEMKLLKTARESLPEDEAKSTMHMFAFVKGENEDILQQQTLQGDKSAAIDCDKGCSQENELGKTADFVEATDNPQTTIKVSAENEEQPDHQSEASIMQNMITKDNNPEGKVTPESNIVSSHDAERVEKIAESHSVEKPDISNVSKILSEEETDKKESAPVIDDTFQKSIQEEIHKEAKSAVTDSKVGKRPENELEENKNDLEAFDHEVTGYTCVKSEKKGEAQSLEAIVINDPNLEGKETAETCPINGTKVLEKEQNIVIPGGVSELLSEYITGECSNEDIPKLKDLSILSDKNTTDVTSGSNKISAYDCNKLDSENNKKIFIAARGCSTISIDTNSEAAEGQENSETGVALEKVITELETGDSRHEQTTNETPADKIVKAADTNKGLKLALDSIAKEQSDKNNCYDTLYKANGTSTDDEKGEKVRNKSDVPEKVAEKLDPDGQSDMHESTKKEKRELPEEKIPEPPYPCKKLESLFDSEAHKILDQISESDDHNQGKQFQSENQIKPESQMEGEHHFSIPLNANPISVPSIISEVRDGVDNADGSENIEKQTIGSGKILSEAQISFPREVTVEQEATSRDSNEATDQEAATKLETQETEITQEGNAKEDGGEDELENVIIKSSRDTDMTKASPKKSHGILSGVGSKVKHSISKVKKAITGKSSSHPKGK